MMSSAAGKLRRLPEPGPPLKSRVRSREEEQERELRRQHAEETMRDGNNGYYHGPDGSRYDFEQNQIYGTKATVYVTDEDQEIQIWKNPSKTINYPFQPPQKATVSIMHASTLKAIHRWTALSKPAIGVLNFANPIRPGGGFMSGAEAQEEMLARSSNLHAMLTSNEGTEFYVKNLDSELVNEGFNSHAMIYSPVVVFMRDDKGRPSPPSSSSVITCSAVNRPEVYRHFVQSPELEKALQDLMRERMARILRLFEECGDRHLILGAFGTGVYKNPIKFVAQTWADLLVGEGARFGQSFEEVVFAIKDEPTYEEFKAEFIKQEKLRTPSPMPKWGTWVHLTPSEQLGELEADDVFQLTVSRSRSARSTINDNMHP